MNSLADIAAMPLQARAKIGEFAERLLDLGHTLIELLDEIDGDPDLEATEAEDDFRPSSVSRLRLVSSPGCPVADPAEEDHWPGEELAE